MKVSSIYLYSTHCYCSVTCLCGARTTNLSLLWVRCDWKENFSPYNVTLAFLSIHHTTRWPLYHTTLCHINLISQPYTKCHCTIYLYFAICCPEAEDRGKNRTKIISVSFNRNHKTLRPFYIPSSYNQNQMIPIWNVYRYIAISTYAENNYYIRTE